jgi:hypothetical protein
MMTADNDITTADKVSKVWARAWGWWSGRQLPVRYMHDQIICFCTNVSCTKVQRWVLTSGDHALELGRCVKSGNRPEADLVKSGYNNTKNAQSFNDPTLCLARQWKPHVWIWQLFDFFSLSLLGTENMQKHFFSFSFLFFISLSGDVSPVSKGWWYHGRL